MECKLAIVIPAYKQKFFYECLESLSVQTNKNFKLYVCNDGSKEDLYSIVRNFENQLDINYVRFEDNLGKKDLVAHWNRSVALAKEPWVWLFSDDDILTKNCVQSFYEVINETEGEYNVYRFNIEMIDARGNIICVKDKHPEIESAYNFLMRRLQSKSLSAAIEYIFRKDIFEKEYGFVNFPLAYCSDDASWIKFAEKKPIYTIPSDTIYWRASGTNISSRKGLQRQKKDSLTQFIEWQVSFFPDNKLEILREAESWFFESIKYIGGALSLADKIQTAKELRLVYPSKSWFYFFCKLLMTK